MNIKNVYSYKLNIQIKIRHIIRAKKKKTIIYNSIINYPNLVE